MSAVQVSVNPCYNCQGKDLVLHYDAGDIICTSCGVVNCSRIIDESDEVRHYEDDENGRVRESRTSGMMELFDTMHTEFITPSQELKAALERCQRKTIDAKDLKIIKYLGQISDACAKMNLSHSIQVSTNHHHVHASSQ